MLIPPFVLMAVLIWLAWFAFAAGWLARRRDRIIAVWAIYGAILGPVALVLLWLAPHGHCRTCHLPTLAWGTMCPRCGENVNEVPRTALRGARTAPAPQPAPARASIELAKRPETPPAPVRRAPRPFVLQSAPADDPGPTAHGPAPGRPVASSPPDLAPLVEPEATPVAAQPAPPKAMPGATKPAQWAPSTTPTLPTDGNRPPDRIVAPAIHRPPVRTEPETGPVTRVLATATYVTGTARLEPGRRYGIAIHESRFQVLGPVDVDATLVALERPVADINVSALEGRLVVSEQRRSGVVLAFMSVAGAGLDELAEAIRTAAGDDES